MKAHKKIKVFFVYPVFSTFVRKDLRLLKKHFSLKFTYYKGIQSIPYIILGTLFSDLTYAWFADIHAFYTVLFSKIFKKKSVVVVGGYEVARLPQINYGIPLSPLLSYAVKYTLKKADRVLPVSQSLKKDAIQNYRLKGENIITVPNGFEPEKFKPKGKKENLVLTVFHCSTWQRVKLKGLDTFIMTAGLLPHLSFLAVGIKPNIIKELKKVTPPNMNYINHLPIEDLVSYYQKAKVYCLLSMREGHPNSLCEAMLCGCNPVATDVPGMRATIGPAGFYVPYGDAKKTAQAIELALHSDKGTLARERIKTLFPLEKREREIVKIINNL